MGMDRFSKRAGWVFVSYLAAMSLVSAGLAWFRFGLGRWEEGLISLLVSVLWGSASLFVYLHWVWRWGK